MNLNKSIILSVITSMLFNSASFAMREIHDAAVRGDLDRVRELVQADPNVVDALNEMDKTPLNLAVANCHSNVVQYLLEKRADVEAHGHLTPLCCAAAYGYDGIARLLLDHNADVDAASRYNQMNPLHFAAMEGCANVAQLLLDHNAGVDAQDYFQMTPLHHTATTFLGSADIVGECLVHRLNIALLLLKHGADINVKNHSDETPLQMSEKNCHKNLAQLLRDWPLYQCFLRGQALAFAMVTYPRLGEHSAARVLDTALCRYISTMVAYPSHTLEEIHQMAEQEREIRSRQSAQQ